MPVLTDAGSRSKREPQRAVRGRKRKNPRGHLVLVDGPAHSQRRRGGRRGLSDDGRHDFVSLARPVAELQRTPSLRETTATNTSRAESHVFMTGLFAGTRNAQLLRASNGVPVGATGLQSDKDFDRNGLRDVERKLTDADDLADPPHCGEMVSERLPGRAALVLRRAHRDRRGHQRGVPGSALVRADTSIATSWMRRGWARSRPPTSSRSGRCRSTRSTFGIRCTTWSKPIPRIDAISVIEADATGDLRVFTSTSTEERAEVVDLAGRAITTGAPASDRSSTVVMFALPVPRHGNYAVAVTAGLESLLQARSHGLRVALGFAVPTIVLVTILVYLARPSVPRSAAQGHSADDGRDGAEAMCARGRR